MIKDSTFSFLEPRTTAVIRDLDAADSVNHLHENLRSQKIYQNLRILTIVS